VNRGQIIDRVLTSLNESTIAPVFWTRAELADILQDGMEVMAEEVMALKRSAFVGLGPGKLYYRTRGIAKDFRVPYRLWLSSNNRKLIPVTVEQLDGFHQQWSTVTGDPEYWAPMGYDWFTIFPHPSTGGGVLRIDYLAWPRVLGGDDDKPEFSESDHDTLMTYGIYDGLLKRWAAPEAMAIFAQFLEKLGMAVPKSGVNQLNGRTWQKESAAASGFRNGIGWRDGR
jgi:hypothetical protein